MFYLTKTEKFLFQFNEKNLEFDPGKKEQKIMLKIWFIHIIPGKKVLIFGHLKYKDSDQINKNVIRGVANFLNYFKFQYMMPNVYFIL